MSGPLGIQAIRNTLNQGLVDKIEEAVKIEAKEQNILRKTSDFKEGIDASINRREPIFKGIQIRINNKNNRVFNLWT